MTDQNRQDCSVTTNLKFSSTSLIFATEFLFVWDPIQFLFKNSAKISIYSDFPPSKNWTIHNLGPTKFLYIHNVEVKCNQGVIILKTIDIFMQFVLNCVTDLN